MGQIATTPKLSRNAYLEYALGELTELRTAVEACRHDDVSDIEVTKANELASNLAHTLSLANAAS